MKKNYRTEKYSILAVIIGTFTSQQTLNTIMPILSRKVGLSELQMGFIYSCSAASIVISSPFWGRLQNRINPRYTIFFAILGAAFGFSFFGLTAWLAIAGIMDTELSFVLFLIFRGLIFGTFLAAIQVSAQSYISSITHGEKDRVSGLSLMGAAIGFSIIAGPVLGGVLVHLGFIESLLMPAVFLFLISIFSWFSLSDCSQELIDDKKNKHDVSLLDSKILPYLITGFGLYLSISIFSMIIGFYVQDKFDLGHIKAIEMHGFIMLLSGIPMFLIQGLIIPKIKPSANRLIMLGLPVISLSFVGILASKGIIFISLSSIFLGIGYGLALPGYTSAPTLMFHKQEQGSVSGLIASTNAMAMMVGPISATALYQINSNAPFILGALAQMLFFTYFIIKFRQKRAYAS